MLEGARAEMARVAEQGGAVEAVPYMKAALVESNRERIPRIESGEQVLVGVNRYTETEPSPLTADAEGGILVVDPAVEEEQKAALVEWRGAARRRGRGGGAGRARAGRALRGERHARDDRRRPRGRDDRRVGRDAARGVRLLPRADRRRRGGRAQRRARSSRSCATRSPS